MFEPKSSAKELLQYVQQRSVVDDYYRGKDGDGIWLGKGAQILGLQGAVAEDELLRLFQNRHPRNDEKLTVRSRKTRIPLWDVTISVPKVVSVLALVGKDLEVVRACNEIVRRAIPELERYATTRVRKGHDVRGNRERPTDNLVVAAYAHQSSRAVDINSKLVKDLGIVGLTELPDVQLHWHLLVMNATFDFEENRWKALQAKPMMSALSKVNEKVNRDLVRRLVDLGYSASYCEEHGVRVDGLDEYIPIFSSRSRARKAWIRRYVDENGMEPSAAAVKEFIRESRARKKHMKQAEFIMAQNDKLSLEQQAHLETVVSLAKKSRITQHHTKTHSNFEEKPIVTQGPLSVPKPKRTFRPTWIYEYKKRVAGGVSTRKRSVEKHQAVNRSSLSENYGRVQKFSTDEMLTTSDAGTFDTTVKEGDGNSPYSVHDWTEQENIVVTSASTVSTKKTHHGDRSTVLQRWARRRFLSQSPLIQSIRRGQRIKKTF